MAIADLPPRFRSIPLSDDERAAIAMFVAEAPTTAPGVDVVAPRRAPDGRLHILLEFPESDTWNLTKALAGLVHRVEDATGIFLHLD